MLSVDVLSPDIPRVTPLRLFSRLTVHIPYCILVTTINISEIPATKITGLKTIAIKFESLNSHISHLSPQSFLKSCIKIRNGDHIINTHKSPTLMMLAIKRKRSPIVKKNRKKSLMAKESVNVAASVLTSVPR